MCATSRLSAGRGFAGVGLAIYLALYLVAGASVANYFWARGVHVTPEQWAYHDLLARLGFSRHHELMDDMPPGDVANVVAIRALLRSPTPLAGTPWTMPFVPDSSLLLLAGMLVAVVAPHAHRRVAIYDVVIREGLRPSPPERPPIGMG